MFYRLTYFLYFLFRADFMQLMLLCTLLFLLPLNKKRRWALRFLLVALPALALSVAAEALGWTFWISLLYYPAPLAVSAFIFLLCSEGTVPDSVYGMGCAYTVQYIAILPGHCPVGRTAPLRCDIPPNGRELAHAGTCGGGVLGCTQALLDGAKAYSDTAIVVVSRITGESNDAPTTQFKQVTKGGDIVEDTNRTYLDLSIEEEELLAYVGENYDKAIVLVNFTNTMALGPIETIPGIDAALLVGGTGDMAAAAIHEVLL